MIRRNNKFLVGIVVATMPLTAFAEGDIDASDPTKIATYGGPGVKFIDFANGDSLIELRATGNIGLGDNDMVMFELGYGHNNGTVSGSDKDTGMTNARARWFHLFEMKPVVSGYRGMATQIDLQFEGAVKGTSGSNTIAAGPMAAFGINENWSFYLPVNAVATWNSDFKNYMGTGISIAPMAAYAPAEGPWPGFFMQIWPSYTRYLSGTFDGTGAANVDLTIGGAPADRWVATAVFQKNFDKNFQGFRRSGVASGANDWNVFVSASYYF